MSLRVHTHACMSTLRVIHAYVCAAGSCCAGRSHGSAARRETMRNHGAHRWSGCLEGPGCTRSEQHSMRAVSFGVLTRRGDHQDTQRSYAHTHCHTVTGCGARMSVPMGSCMSAYQNAGAHATLIGVRMKHMHACPPISAHACDTMDRLQAAAAATSWCRRNRFRSSSRPRRSGRVPL